MSHFGHIILLELILDASKKGEICGINEFKWNFPEFHPMSIDGLFAIFLRLFINFFFHPFHQIPPNSKRKNIINKKVT